MEHAIPVSAGERFRALHQRDHAFIIPNPWDIGSARILQALGFEALASTSAGFAFTRGRPDTMIGRDAMLAHLRELVAATTLPVSADLENGFGHAPAVVEQTIVLAAETGLAGGSIEDSSNATQRPERIYPLAEAVDRIRAAAEAVRGLAKPFVLTARAENYLHGRPDLTDTIRRLQAYGEAGAEVLYAPGVVDPQQLATLVREVGKPVNVNVGIKGARSTLAELSALGVKRVSVGGALARFAFGAVVDAARVMQQEGRFDFVDRAIATPDLVRLFDAPQP